jgi:hypothetical protein
MALEQHADELGVTAGSRDHEWRHADVVGRVGVSAGSKQMVCALDEAALARCEQRGATLVASPIEVDAASAGELSGELLDTAILRELKDIQLAFIHHAEAFTKVLAIAPPFLSLSWQLAPECTLATGYPFSLKYLQARAGIGKQNPRKACRSSVSSHLIIRDFFFVLRNFFSHMKTSARA